MNQEDKIWTFYYDQLSDILWKFHELLLYKTGLYIDDIFQLRNHFNVCIRECIKRDLKS